MRGFRTPNGTGNPSPLRSFLCVYASAQDGRKWCSVNEEGPNSLRIFGTQLIDGIDYAISKSVKQYLANAPYHAR